MSRIRFDEFDIGRVTFDVGEKFMNKYTRYGVKYKYNNDFLGDLRMTTQTATSLLECTYIGMDKFGSGHSVTLSLDDDKFYTIAAKIADKFKDHINRKKDINIPISDDFSKLYCKLIESKTGRIYTEFYTHEEDGDIINTPVEDLKAPLSVRPIFTMQFIVGPTVNMKVQIAKSYYKKVKHTNDNYDLAFRD
jgi:hypothetical protein